MRTLRVAAWLLLFIGMAALASPLFGTWKVDLNGTPATVIVSHDDNRVSGKMMIGSGASARELPLTNVRIVDRPPSTLRFEVENWNGAARTTFELHAIDSQNATLQQVGDGLTANAMKAVKQK